MISTRHTLSHDLIDTDRLKDRIDCRDLARHLLGEPVRKSSNYNKYYSPFRDDGQKAALTVYPDSFKDYGGSGDYWDAIEFVMVHQMLGFQDACQFLTRFTAGELPRQTHRPAPKRSSSRTRDKQPPSAAWQKKAGQLVNEWQDNLWQTPAVLDYLKERGLTEATIRHYRLGYNPDWKKWLPPDSREKKTTKIAPGITIPWFADGTLYAVRVRTSQGSLADYTGRDDSYLDKYMSVTGSHQSAGLFGADNLRDGADVLLVEGEFDAMLASQESDLIAVTRGSAGDHAHISRTWLDNLGRADTVYVALDADEAGQTAQQAVMEQLTNSLPLTLPAGFDLTDYLLTGQGSIDALLQTAPAERPVFPGPTAPSAPSQRGNRQAKRSFSDKINRIELSPFSATHTVHLRYMSALKRHLANRPTLLIRSPIATGKTEFIKERLIEHGDDASFLSLTVLQNLIGNTVQRLNEPSHAGTVGRAVHSYRDLDGSHINRVNRLSITLDSLVRRDDKQFDLVVIDEAMQVFGHLGSSTLRGKAVDTFKALVEVIQKAGQLILLDAHLDDTVVNLIKTIRGDVTAIENTHRHNWGRLTVHESDTSLIACALDKAARSNKPINIQSDNRRVLEQIFEVAADQFDRARLLMISGNTSGSREAHAVRNDLDRLGEYDIIFSSPSWGSGIDIQQHMAGVYGLFYPQLWNSATTVMQQFMRCRNADERHIYVPHLNQERNEETDWKIIQARYQRQVSHTFDVAGLWDVGYDRAQDIILMLLAKYQAERGRQRVDFVSSVVTLARNEGFDIAFQTGHSQMISNRLAFAAQRLKERDKSATMTNDPVPPEVMDEAEQGGQHSIDELYTLQTGHHRWMIEDLTGRLIDNWSYDRLHSSAGKSQFACAVDLLEWLQEPQQIKQLDRQEAEADILFIHRRSRSPKAKLAADALEVVWPGITQLLQQGSLDAIEQRYDWMTREELGACFADFARTHRQQISDFFERGGNYSDDPVFVFRTVLRHSMIRLQRKKVRDENGKSVWAYRIDIDDLHETYGRVVEALEHRREKRNELFQNTLNSTICYDVLEQEPVYRPSVPSGGGHLPPLRPDQQDLSLL